MCAYIVRVRACVYVSACVRSCVRACDGIWFLNFGVFLHPLIIVNEEVEIKNPCPICLDNEDDAAVFKWEPSWDVFCVRAVLLWCL